MSENKVDLRKLLTLSGNSNLFQFVGKTKNGVIVENINDKHRTVFGETAKISSLSDIAIYTNTEEVPLKDLFEKIKAKEENKAIEAVSKKSEPEAVKTYFESVIPDYDRDRLYVSHMRKIIDWYNQLHRNDLLDFQEEETEQEEKTEEQATE